MIALTQRTDQPTDLSAQFADPAWLLHQLDLASERALLVRLDAQTIAKAAFLDQRVLDVGTPGFWVPLSLMLRATPSSASVPRAIFHVGHCGSTLVSRLLDALIDGQVLREPMTLRALAMFKATEEKNLAASESFRRLARCVWQWYGNRGDQGATACNIVKATSATSGIASDYLQLPGSKAMALTVGLETYLATVLKGDRRDIRGFADQRARELDSLVGAGAIDGQAMNDPRLATIAWFVANVHFERGRAQGLEIIDFDQVLQQPVEQLQRINDLLDIRASAKAIGDLQSHEVWTRYSKQTDTRYDRNDRAHDLALSKRRFGAEIRDGLQFYERLRQLAE